jgi:hypothetical protein
VRSFDARPLRTTDERGIWDFVAGCLRAYEILADKVDEFARDPEVQAVRREIEQVDGPRRTFLYERLDHLVFEILTGTRGR